MKISTTEGNLFSIWKWYVMTGTVVFLLGFAYLWEGCVSLTLKAEKEKSTLISQIPVLSFPNNEKKISSSYIPAFYMAATKQPVQPPPLNRIFKDAIGDETENYAAVMDKVIVAPKDLNRKGAYRG